MVKRYNSPISYHLREIPIKQIKIWKDAQARKLDREGIAELARSIKNEGLQNPPMVQKESKNSYLVDCLAREDLLHSKGWVQKRFQYYYSLRSTKYDQRQHQL